MKYEVILFDADDTLFDFQKSENHAFKMALSAYHDAYEEDVHYRAYHEINRRIWKELEEGLITQKALKVERFRRLGEALGMDFPPEEFAELYMHHLSHASFVFPEAEALLSKLSGKYKMSIITNGLTSVQKIRIRESSISSFFHEVVISEEIGMAKPDPKIFRYALKRLNHESLKTVLMVGDSLTSDIQGGINAGIDTCWYNPQKKKKCSACSPYL